MSPIPRATSARGTILLMVGAALLILWVQRRSLFSFFAPDDLIHLQQALDLEPTPKVPWRFLTQVVYFRFMVRTVGLHPLAFMAVNLILHLTNCGLSYRLIRMLGASARVAGLAVVCFGAFPLFVTVVGRAVTINEILALTFTLLMFMVLQCGGWRSRLGAPVAFLLALLSKESVLFMPLLAPVMRRPGMRLPDAARRAAPLFIEAVLFGILFASLRSRGLAPGGTPYTVGFGVNLFHNLMTYAAWSVDLLHPIPDLVRSFNPSAWRVGLWVIGVLLGLSLLDRTQGRLVVLGLIGWAMGLLPVLPLEHSTYGHYMYLSMVGFMLAASAGIACLVSAMGRRVRAQSRKDASGSDVAISSPRRAVALRHVPGVLFAAIALAYALRSDAMIQARYERKVPSVQLPLDPFLRGSDVAEAATMSVGHYLQTGDHELLVLTPRGTTRTLGARSGRRYADPRSERRAYDLVAAVIDNGRALRLFYPQLDSIVFVTEWSRSYRHYALFMEGWGGSLIGFGQGADGQIRASEWMLENHLYAPARDHLSRVLEEYGSDRRLRLV